MRVIREKLKERHKSKEPIRVAVVGSGWFGGGLIREICHYPGIECSLIVNRTMEKAVQELKNAEILSSDIIEVKSLRDYENSFNKGKYIVSDNFDILRELKRVDVVFEATGNIELGAKIALEVLSQKIHFITANIEMDATVGFAIDDIAKKNNVVYSVTDGDQPGVLSKMIAETQMYGFKTVVAGSCKGFLDVYQNPADVMPWVRSGHNPKMIAAFADGTKQSLEMTVLANGNDLVPDIRGMHGIKTSKKTIVDDYLKVITKEGIVDYAMGFKDINEGAGVFVIGKRDDKFTKEDFKYLKKGKGPYYLFFRDHHLCYFEAIKSIAEAFLFGVSTLEHRKKTTDCLAVAKKDLSFGERLDGIGGFSVYGLVDTAKNLREENLLPIGLSEYAIVTKKINKDTPITYDRVDFLKENIVLKLRRQEDFISNK